MLQEFRGRTRIQTSDRHLLYARCLHLGQREGMVRLGKSKSRVVSAILVEKRVCDEVSAWNNLNNECEGLRIRGCSVIKREYTRLCARVYEEDRFVASYRGRNRHVQWLPLDYRTEKGQFGS
jgi:hypothetical protein